MKSKTLEKLQNICRKRFGIKLSKIPDLLYDNKDYYSDIELSALSHKIGEKVDRKNILINYDAYSAGRINKTNR